MTIVTRNRVQTTLPRETCRTYGNTLSFHTFDIPNSFSSVPPPRNESANPKGSTHLPLGIYLTEVCLSRIVSALFHTPTNLLVFSSFFSCYSPPHAFDGGRQILPTTTVFVRIQTPQPSALTGYWGSQLDHRGAPLILQTRQGIERAVPETCASSRGHLLACRLHLLPAQRGAPLSRSRATQPLHHQGLLHPHHCRRRAPPLRVASPAAGWRRP